MERVYKRETEIKDNYITEKCGRAERKARSVHIFFLQGKSRVRHETRKKYTFLFFTCM